MWFRSMFKSLSRSSRRRLQRTADRKQQARRLLLEGLEDRRLLAFVPAASYAVGGDPKAVIAADFNNDGRLDMATANFTTSNVSVLLGNADGTFQPALNSPTGTNPLSVAVGDFDGDGKLDLATANLRDVSVLKGNGLGGFAAPASVGLGWNPSSVAVGDFNGDGKLDLGVTSNNYYPGGCTSYGCYAGGYAGYANVLLGNGSGAFSEPISNLISGAYYSSAASADFNGDGKQDFAAIGSYDGSVVVLPGTSTGALGSPAYFSAGYGASSLTAKDVNGDLKADIVTANRDYGSVSVLVGNGLGSFAAAQTYAAGASPSSVAVADFNGDFRSDLIAANLDNHTVSVLLGTASGTFKPPVNVATGVFPVGTAVGDFNGDGRADAATANLNATFTAGQVSVLLNDSIWPALDAPSITIADAGEVTEGNTGTVNANFTVSLSAQSNQPVSVVYSTQNGGATGGSDYQTESATLTFNPGETSKIVSIPVNGDRIGEFSESFFVKLSDPLNAFVADATGLGTILDDEPVVNIDGDFSDVEGNTGAKSFTFTVSLSSEYDVPVTVDYFTGADWDGSATAGDDYIAKSGTLTFAAHQTTSESITVLVNGDRIGEWDELFLVNLSNPNGARLGVAQAQGMIVNDEPYVWIEGAMSIPERNSGQSAMTFTLRLSAPYDIPVTVDYATADNTANAGSDYVAVAGTATIAANTTSQTITVLVNGDTQAEDNEYLEVNISGVSGAILSGGSAYAYGLILDDDTPPSIYIGDAYMTEGNSGTRSMTFNVSLSHPSGQTVSVSYATANGTAKTSDNDYLAASGRLDFAAGETEKTITVTIRGDTRKEANEQFLVKLSGAIGATIADAQGQGTIANDDGGGKGNGKGNRSNSFALAVDAAIDDWMAFPQKKRGR